MKKLILILLLPYLLIAATEKDSISNIEYKSDEIIVIDDDFNAVQKNMNTVLNSVRRFAQI
ncbi:MAG: hypothetical protein R2863_08735 [Candidatus Kapaibacterium sp.]